MSQEKNAWFLYREGYDPRVLELGTLAFDYANPDRHDPYSHPSLSDKDRLQWTLSAEWRDTFLTFDGAGGFGISGGILNLASLRVERGSGSSLIIASERAEAVQLLNAKTFLNDVVLSDINARNWLSSRLGIARKLYYLKKLKREHPIVWMATKVLKMEDARVFSATEKSSGHGLEAKIPIPDPTTVTQILQIQPGIKLQLREGIELQSTTQIMGKRVWAAQFQQLELSYEKLVTSVMVPKPPNVIPLLNVYSAKRYRGAAEVVEVTVTEKTQPQDLNSTTALEEEYDEIYWKEFSLELEKVLEDLDN